jgi:hypothetical protein
MSKNPLVNALGAFGYITLVATIIHFISKTQSHKPDPAFAPVIFLSLLTLSVAIMGYIFFYQPFQLLIDGKKKEGASLFVKTVGIFGAITFTASVLLFVFR